MCLWGKRPSHQPKSQNCYLRKHFVEEIQKMIRATNLLRAAQFGAP